MWTFDDNDFLQLEPVTNDEADHNCQLRVLLALEGHSQVDFFIWQFRCSVSAGPNVGLTWTWVCWQTLYNIRQYDLASVFLSDNRCLSFGVYI